MKRLSRCHVELLCFFDLILPTLPLVYCVTGYTAHVFKPYKCRNESHMYLGLVLLMGILISPLATQVELTCLFKQFCYVSLLRLSLPRRKPTLLSPRVIQCLGVYCLGTKPSFPRSALKAARKHKSHLFFFF